MDDLSTRINQVLNDPQSMEQILSIAKSLGMQPPAPQEAAQTPAIPDTAVADAMRQAFSGVAQADPRQAALFQALRPYLRPERQGSLERALQAAKLAKLARFALQNLK